VRASPGGSRAKLRPPGEPGLPGRFLRRFLAFGLLWLVLTGADPGGWVLGVGIVAAVAWTSLRIAPPVPGRVRSLAALRSIFFFLRYSLSGGIDVALRAIRPRPGLDPKVLSFDLRIPEGRGCMLVAAIIGLFPGTLATRLEGRRLHLHVLDVSVSVEPQLRELELRVADLFGLPLEDADGIR